MFRRILGIDPGLASTGFGIVDCSGTAMRMLCYGVIETAPGMDMGLRLAQIYDELDSVIKRFSPQEAGMEELFFARNVSSAMHVAEAKGVATLCVTRNGIPLGMYKPNQIKMAVTGGASADKELVQRSVCLLLRLQEPVRPDHASDALAAAITHCHYTAGAFGVRT